MSRMIVSRPFGVLKNRTMTWEASSLVTFERRREQEALDAVTLQQPQSLMWPQRKRRRREDVGEHGVRPDDTDAGELSRGAHRSRIEEVTAAVGPAALVVA